MISYDELLSRTINRLSHLLNRYLGVNVFDQLLWCYQMILGLKLAAAFSILLFAMVLLEAKSPVVMLPMCLLFFLSQSIAHSIIFEGALRKNLAQLSEEFAHGSRTHPSAITRIVAEYWRSRHLTMIKLVFVGCLGGLADSIIRLFRKDTGELLLVWIPLCIFAWVLITVKNLWSENPDVRKAVRPILHP